MVVKTLQVFYGGDCLPYKDREHKIHYPIVTPAFQGASQVNEIKFYVDYIGGSMLKWLAVAKLPNGRVGMKLLDFAEDELGTYVTLTLTQWFTQAKGDLYVSLKGFDGESDIVYDEETGLYHISGEPIVQATGSVKITIQYATPLDNEDYGDITIQELIGYINTKLDKNSGMYVKVITSILDINSSIYADYLASGDIVLSKADNKTYQLSGTYPTLTYSQVILENDQVHVTGNESVNGEKTFISGIWVGDLSRAGNTNWGKYGPTELYVNRGTIGETEWSIRLTTDTTNDHWGFILKELGTTYNIELPLSNGVLATQGYVDSAIETVKRSMFVDVDTSEYPTLNDFLATTGEEGKIYLYPIDTSDLTKGYQQYIWENNSWRYIGDTQLDLSGYVTTNTTQEISGEKTFSGKQTFANEVSFINLVRINLATFLGNIVPNSNNTYHVGDSARHYARGYINYLYGADYTFETDKAYQILYDLNIPSGGFGNPLSYEGVNTIIVGRSGTFTLQTPKISCLPEYHGTITNDSQTAITLTFTGVSTILSNDDSLTITNGTNSSLVLPAGTTIEFSIYNGKMVAVNFAAE